MRAKFIVLLLVVMVFSTMVISNAESVLSLYKDNYVIGETVTVTFSNVTGNEQAWIAIYPEGAAYTEYQADEKVWKYANTDTETNDSIAVTEGTVTLSTAGLVAGEYHVSYFVDGAYNEGASATFTLAEEKDTNPQTSDEFVALSTTFAVLMLAVVLKIRLATV